LLNDPSALITCDIEQEGITIIANVAIASIPNTLIPPIFSKLGEAHPNVGATS
jgi:hypothetical protein